MFSPSLYKSFLHAHKVPGTDLGTGAIAACILHLQTLAVSAGRATKENKIGDDARVVGVLI